VRDSLALPVLLPRHLVNPLAANVGAHVGLVLVIGRDNLDLQSLARGEIVFDCQASGDDRADAGNIGIEA
jgi:hypothetical protein